MFAQKRRRRPKRHGYIETRDIQIDRNIISTGPHRGHTDPSWGVNFYCRDYTAEPLACSLMRCAQLRAAQMFAKNQRRQPNIQIDRNRYIQTYRQIHIHISLIVPYWGPLDPSAGINASRCWNPILENNKNTKTTKGLRKTGRTDRQMDILYCHSGYLTSSVFGPVHVGSM